MQFWYPFGSVLGSFWLHFVRLLGPKFALISEVCFFLLFWRFRSPFWMHFGLQNRSGTLPDAKSSTLDFKRHYNETPAF